MSPTRLQETADKLEQAAIQLAWRQWRVIGGSAVSDDPPATSIVDPEALVLASLALANREHRLTDLLYGWMEKSAPFLSVQRLKNLKRRYPAETRNQVSEFARRARNVAKHPRWASLADQEDAGLPDIVLPEVSRATSPPKHSAPGLMLALRMAMGVGTKSDALAVVLGQTRSLTVRDVVEGTAYNPVSVRSALEDLSGGGFLRITDRKPLKFGAPLKEWRALLALDKLPRWMPWHDWYAFAFSFLSWARSAAERNVSDYAFQVRVRELLAHHELLTKWVIPDSNFVDARTSGDDLIAALTVWPHENA
jgi:hypothetical protein